MAKSLLILKFCPFCLAPIDAVTRTNEHVIPQWLLRHYKVATKNIHPAGYEGEKSFKRRPHPWISFKVANVCKSCNSGWLSILENEAKPHILALAESVRTLASLSIEEQTVLARWAVKTAFLMNRTSNSSIQIPWEKYVDLRKHPAALPDGIFVFAFQDDGTDRVRINGFQTCDWHLNAPKDDFFNAHDWANRSSKISLRIGQLHLLTAHLVNNQLEPVGWHRVHRPLHPTICRLWFDNGFQVDRVTRREESSMALFHASLGAAYNVPQQWLIQNPPNLEQLHEDFYKKHMVRMSRA